MVGVCVVVVVHVHESGSTAQRRIPYPFQNRGRDDCERLVGFVLAFSAAGGPKKKKRKWKRVP